MKKAFVIIRVSGKDQLKGNGPDAQWEDDVLPNAPVLELEVNEEYKRVIQESASGWNRPKFEVAVNEAIELYKRGEIQAVLFPRVDRETRFLFSSVPLLNKLMGAGLEVYFAEEQLYLDPNDPDSVQRYTDKVKAAQDYIATLRRNTIKGRGKRVKKGKLPTGTRMFGYIYIKGKEEGEGIRIINEDEAVWIRRWRNWVLEDGLTINRISFRMRAEGIPKAPSTIRGILANPAIMGKTYTYTCSYEKYTAPDGTHKKRLVKKPREEWVEIPDATPAIISKEEFLAIQAKLTQNKQLGGCKNAKTKYLWAGHLFCCFDNRRYRGKRTTNYNTRIPVVYEYYECPCKNRIVSAEKCPNRSWRREELDQLLWDKVEALLSQPEAVLVGIKAVEADSTQADYFMHTLADVEARLSELEEEQKQLLRQSLMGFPEELVIKENQKINDDRTVPLQRKVELEAKIEQAKQTTINMDNIKLVCDIVRKSLGNLTYEDKRLAIEALDIMVWINHNELRMEGSIPIPDDLSNLSITSRCSG
ncbi:MAG TPA: recombinase family protein [Dehalococcoidia bacterium]|nr:recombinase family protein [Dehalococcoidia bacterium]